MWDVLIERVEAMTDWYDRQGQKISLEDANAKMGDYYYKVLEKTELPDGRRVSTVWLGLDMRYDEGPPLIFETMVFPKDSQEDLDMERYETEEGARIGHRLMVEKWRKK